VTRWRVVTVVIGLAMIGFNAILSTSGSITVPARSSDVADFHEGPSFPAIVFPSLADGRPRSISDFHGKKLILHIFASW
jgi:hypothetical protein